MNLETLTDKELLILKYEWNLWARHNQKAPEGPWNKWLINAGRGFGKTRTGAELVRYWAENNPNWHIALVGRTTDDVIKTMIEGPSGILACCPPWNKPTFIANKKQITWSNGAKASYYTAEKPDQLRGPNHHAAWADELAAWQRMETWDQLMFTLRLGNNPQVVITTTPRPIKIIKELTLDSKDNKNIQITTGSTFDNKANLADTFLTDLMKKYEGTRLGRQELYAEILEDSEGALWNYKNIEINRITLDTNKQTMPQIQEYLNNCVEIVVAIDLAVTSNEDSDETGIIVAGKTINDVYYIIEDASGIYNPAEWADKAIELYKKYQANYVVAETNQGGDMIQHTLNTRGFNIPFKGVHASKGKATRAEPISSLYEQNLVKHLGNFNILEDQMTTWIPGVSKYSPDRMDALVWAITSLSNEFKDKMIPFVLQL